MKTLPLTILAATLLLPACDDATATAPPAAQAEAALSFASLPQLVSITGIEVATDKERARVSVEFRNAATQDIRFSLTSEAGIEQILLPEFAIGDYQFAPEDLPDEITVPAGGTRRIRFHLHEGFNCNYDPESQLHSGERDTVAIALRKGGDIRFRYAVQTWQLGDRHYLNEQADFAMLDYAAPSPRMVPPEPGLAMPEGPYKVGEAALADICGIYDAAAYRKFFRQRPSSLKPFADYLRTGEPTPLLLSLACHYNCPGLVEELLARGVDANDTRVYWDMFDSTGDEESTRFSTLGFFYDAALPSFYRGGASAAKAKRIINLLLDAGANRQLGDSPLPFVARVEHDGVHFEEVFLHLLDKGWSLDEERVTPKLSEQELANAQKRGYTIDKARITPQQREGIISDLKYRRELGFPWRRVEARLGLSFEPEYFPEPEQGDIDLLTGEDDEAYVPLAEADNGALRHALEASSRVRITPPGSEPIELSAEESARLLAPLRRVPRWHRLLDKEGKDVWEDSGLRLAFTDEQGRDLTAFCPRLHLLCYASDRGTLFLEELVERYLPDRNGTLPPAQQIKVMGRLTPFFVLDGESLPNADALRQKARPDLAYELIFDDKQRPAGVQALREELGKSMRIERVFVPTNNNIIAPAPEDFMLKEGEQPVAYSDEGDFCYAPLPEAENAQLRDALARCATLRLELSTADDGDKEASLARSDAPVRTRLESLAETDAWLDTRQSRGMDIDPSCWGTLSLLDAEGKVLWQGSVTDICRVTAESGEIESLLDALEHLLPFKL